MGVDVTYYIGGFNGPTKKHKEVIATAKELRFGYKDNMSLSSLDDPEGRYKNNTQYNINDGYCVIQSLTRANKPEYQEDIDNEIARLTILFPGHPIHRFNDYDEREDVVKILDKDPTWNRVA